jgi:DNA-binding NarL/FixJ family response regulator
MDFSAIQPGDAVIADSNRLNAESIAWCLKAYGGFRNVTAVSTAAELIQTIRSQRPQTVLVCEKLIVKALRDVFSELAVRLGETRVAVFGDGLTDRQLDLVVNNRVTGLLSREDTMKKISEQLGQFDFTRSASARRTLPKLRQQSDAEADRSSVGRAAEDCGRPTSFRSGRSPFDF